MEGWIKLHRRIKEWGWYSDRNVKAVFIDLLIEASYAERTADGIQLAKGQCKTTVKQLAKDNGMSEREVRTALMKLEKTGEIDKQTTNKYTVITICNYAKYQDIESYGEEHYQQTNNNQTTNEQQSNNKRYYIKERNKGRNKEMNNKHTHTALLYNEICKDLPKTNSEIISEARSEKAK